jgi:glycosyltransferase involved in cell wall biosynthesis
MAFIPDLTIKIYPEFHPPGNVAEFEEYLQYALNHAHYLATLSENSKNDIMRLLHVDSDRVIILPAYVNPVYMREEYDREILEYHGIYEPYLLSVCTMEPRKNLRRLVKSFELLIRKHNDVNHTLVLAGPDGWDDGFSRFLQECEVYSRIRRIGFAPIEHLPSLYHFASAFIYPSIYEGFGLPVLEAMHCSAVVVSSGTSAMPEILGERGLYFNPFDTEEMADIIYSAVSMEHAKNKEYRSYCFDIARSLIQKWRTHEHYSGAAIR